MMPDIKDNWGIIGHTTQIQYLQSRLRSGRIGHAYLFTGARGIGKSTMALRLAQAVNCTSSTTQPCGVCRSCELTERRAHPDIHILSPESKRIKIDDIRDLTHSLTLPPLEANYRIAIIEEMDRATASGADALLKTLEEPPPRVKIFLTTEVAEGLLATIVSRCQVISLRPVPISVLEESLSGNSRAALIARLSGGRPGWALETLNNQDVLDDRKSIIDTLIRIPEINRVERFALAESLTNSSDLDYQLDILQSLWRDILLMREGSNVPITNLDYSDHIQYLAQSIQNVEALTVVKAIRETINLLSLNVNKRLALEVLMLDIPFL